MARSRDMEYRIGFTGDTTQLQAALREAQAALEKVSHLSMENGITSDMTEAARAARELGQQLQNAVNVDTGKLDLSRFMLSLEQGNMSLEKYAAKLQAIGPAGEQAFMKVSAAISMAEVPIARSSALLDRLWTTMKNTMRWRFATGALNSFVGAIQSAYGYAKDLNESLNNIRIVTGDSTEQMAAFAKNANDAARNLSTTTTAYTDASLIYYQQGLPDEEVRERTDATIKLANVTGQSAETVSSQMTAIWNNFDDGSRSLESFEDVMVALGASTATSSKEIAEGVAKFAPIANTVGLSFDYAAAALATITATTRESASVAGTALKTLFSRLEGLKLGETLEDGTDLNKYSEALQKVGIEIKDLETGELKDMDTILDELGNKWELLARDEQMALAETVGGVRQYAQLVALMDNWTDFQKNLATAQGSEGALQKQADVYAESWKAARAEVKNAAQDIYDSLINADFFVDFDKGFADFLHGVATSVDAIGGMKGAITLLGSVFLTVFQDKIAKSLDDLAYNFDFITGKAQKAQMAFKEQSASLAYAMASDSANPQTAAMNQAQIQAQDIQMQNVLNGLAKELTEEQFKQLTYAKENITQIEKVALGYEDAKDNLAQVVQHQKENLADTAGLNAALTLSSKQSFALKNNLNAALRGGGVQNLVLKKQDVRTYDDLVQTFERLNEKAGGLATLRAQVAGLNPELTKDSATVQQLFRDFQKLTGMTLIGSGPEEWLKQVEAALKGTKDAAELAGDAIKTHFAAGATSAEIDAISQAVKQLGDAAATTGANAQSLSGAQAAASDSLKTWASNLQNTLNQGMSFSQQLVTIANGMMRLGMLAQSVKNLVQIWDNDDLTIGEKWIQTLTSVGMIIPSLTTVIQLATKAQNKYKVSVIEGTAAEQAQRVADLNTAKSKVVMTGAVEGNTVAVTKNTTAWLANPLGWIVLAITAVVAAFAAYNGAIEKQNKLLQENAQAQADEADKNAKAAKEEIDAIQELYKTYVDLYAIQNDTTDSKENLKESTDKLCEALDIEWDALERERNQYENVNAEIRETLRLKALEGIETTQEGVKQTRKNIVASGSSLNPVNDDTRQIVFKSGANYFDETSVSSYLTSALHDAGFLLTSGPSGEMNYDFSLNFKVLFENEDEFFQIYQIISDTIDELEEKAELDPEFAKELEKSEVFQNAKAWLKDLEDDFIKIEQYQQDLITYSEQLAEAELRTKLSNVKTLDDYEKVREEYITSLRKIFEEQGILTDSMTNEYFEGLADTHLRGYNNLKQYASELSIVESILKRVVPGGEEDPLYNSRKSVIEGLIEDSDFKTSVLSSKFMDWDTLAMAEDFENAVKEAYKIAEAKINAENYQIEIPIITSAISNIESGKDLTEEELAKVKALEEEYPKLAAIRDRTSAQYVQALRDIREGMEHTVSVDALEQLKDAWDKLNTHLKSDGRSEAAKIRIDLDSADFAKQMKEIMDADYSVQVAIEADLQSDMDDAIRHASQIEAAAGKISEGFKVAAADIEDVQKAFPGILAGYTVTADGMIQLDQEIAQGAIDLANTQVQSENEAAKANIQSYKEVLLSKAAAMRTIAEGLGQLLILTQQEAAGEVVSAEEVGDAKTLIENGISQMKDAAAQEQALISGDLATSEIEDSNQVLDAENNAATQSSNNWAQAYMSMAQNSASWAKIAIANANKVGQAIANAAKAGDGEFVPASEEATSGGVFGVYSGGFEAKEYSNTYEGGGGENLSWEDYYDKAQNSEGQERIDAYQAAMEAAIAQAQAYEQAAANLDAYLAKLDATGTGLDNLVSNIGKDTGGKGGGGSSGKPSNEKALEQIKEAIERYHEITREIEYQEKVLSKLEKQIDRTYGVERLKLYKKQLEELNHLAELQAQKRDAAIGFVAIDQARLNELGLNPIVNEFSLDIENFTELVTQAQEEYKAAIAAYNYWIETVWNAAQTKEEQEMLQETKEAQKAIVDAAKELYEEREKALELYEKSVDTYREQQEAYEETMRQIEDAKLNEITYKMKIVIDIRDAKKAINDFSRDIEESFGDFLTHGLKAAVFDEANAREEMAMYQHYVEEYEALKQRLAEANEYTDTDAIIEELKNLEQNIIESGEALLEWLEKVENMFVNALEAAAARFEHFTNQIAHDTEILGTIKELYALQGVTYKTAEGFQRIQNASEGQYQGYLRQAQLNKQWYENASAKLAEAEAALAGVEETDVRYDALKKNRDALLDEANKAQKAMLENSKAAMEMAKEMYLTEIDRMSYELEQKLTNGMGFDLMQEKYEHMLEESDRYLDNVEESLETSLWYSKLQQDIDKTTNKAYKDRLKQLQEEIDLRREDNTLSEYDLELLEAKYKVLQAQAALEDEQNNKNKLRLVRDSNGNWNYQYTADQGNIEAKQQDLLAAKKEEYEITKQQVRDLEAELMKLPQEAAQAATQIYKDMAEGILSPEEGQAKLDELQRYYIAKAEYLQTELDWAREDMSAAALTSEVLAAGLAESVYNTSSDLIKDIVDVFKTEGGDQLIAAASVSFDSLRNALAPHLEAFAESTDAVKEQLLGILTTTDKSTGISFQDFCDRLSNEEKGKLEDALAKWGGPFADTTSTIRSAFDKILHGEGDGSSLDDLHTAIGNTKGLYNYLLVDSDSLGKAADGLAGGFTKDISRMIDSIIDPSTGFVPTLEKWLPEMGTKFDDFRDKIEETADAIGVDPGNLDDMVQDLTDDIEDMYDEGENAIDMMWDQLDAIYDLQQAYLDWADAIMEVIRQLEDLARHQVVPTIEDVGEGGGGTGEDDDYDFNDDYSDKMAQAASSLKWEDVDKYAGYREKKMAELRAQGVDTSQYVSTAKLQSLLEQAFGRYDEIDEKDKELQELILAIMRDSNRFFNELASYASGGYTGTFDSNNGALAFLHQKELVLNADDTEKILEAVHIMRGISDTIFKDIADQLDYAGTASMATLGSLLGGTQAPAAETVIEQHVTIEQVNFPGVTSSREIEEAFESLVNDAAQWARHRKS